MDKRSKEKHTKKEKRNDRASKFQRNNDTYKRKKMKYNAKLPDAKMNTKIYLHNKTQQESTPLTR